jgi:hypothetical protein
MSNDSKFDFLGKVEFNIIWTSCLNSIYLLMLLTMSGVAFRLKIFPYEYVQTINLYSLLAFAYIFIWSYLLVLLELFFVYRYFIFHISYKTYQWFGFKYYYLDVLKEELDHLPQDKIHADRLPSRPREYEDLYSILKKTDLKQFYEAEGVLYNPINMHFGWLISWETILFPIVCVILPRNFWQPNYFWETIALGVFLFILEYFMDMNSARQEFNLFNGHRAEMRQALLNRFKR